MPTLPASQLNEISGVGYWLQAGDPNCIREIIEGENVAPDNCKWAVRVVPAVVMKAMSSERGACGPRGCNSS